MTRFHTCILVLMTSGIAVSMVACGADEAVVQGPSLTGADATVDVGQLEVSGGDDVGDDVGDDIGDDIGGAVDAGPDVSPGCTTDQQCSAIIKLKACFVAVCKLGTCVAEFSPSGIACDDGDACSKDEACAGGVCSGGKNVCGCKTAADCDDNNACTKDSCGDGACVYTGQAGASCDDGNGCTGAGACTKDGDCAKGKTKVCDDNNPCTDDSCKPSVGCTALANSLSCDDGDACTDKTVCTAGKCGGGAAKKCDDGKACTMDSCDPKKGCVWKDATGAADAKASCDDGNSCTTADTCSGGTCSGGPALTCDDGDACTVDSCDTVKGCLTKAAKDGGVCDDGDACTVKDVCAKGTCVGGGVKSCTDANPCTDNTCNAKLGCVVSNNGAKCADNKSCVSGTCAGGTCKLGSSLGCDDNNVCTTDSCDKAKGCVYLPVKSGLKCDDGNKCSDDDSCKNGVCGGKLLDCDDDNPCTTDNCSAKLGCSWGANTAACDDGNPCTAKGTCSGGKCKGAKTIDPKKLCDDKNVCTTDSCNAKTGCSYAPVPVAKPCDGKTVNGHCYKAVRANANWGNAEKACVSWGGHLVSIANAKEDVMVRALARQVCGQSLWVMLGARDTVKEGTWRWVDGTPWSYSNWDNGQPNNSGNQDYLGLRTNGKWNDVKATDISRCRVCERVILVPKCDDGDVCTKNEVCAGGKCGGGVAAGCDDGKVCTVDLCDSKTGACSWAGKSGACDDGDACKTGSACKAGKCLGGVATSCDDKNPCTADACDPKTGKCVHSGLKSGCDDGDLCTSADVCSGGSCVGVAKSCVDGEPCTTDGCDGKTGSCIHAKIPGCTGCKTAADCDDDDPCTDHACDGATAKCSKTFNKKPCDTGDACTYGDRCDGKGGCVVGKSNACDDDNVCTKDSCDTGKGQNKGKNTAKNGGCVHTALADGAACSDGKACTTGDVCASGACTPKKDDCDLLFSSFDCGKPVSGWILGSNGGSPALRWAVDNAPLTSAASNGASGGCNLNYNNGKNYCRPYSNRCYTPNQSAYSPVINASAATGTPRLSFWTYYDLDGVNTTTTDLPRVRISAGNQTLYLFSLKKDAGSMKVWRKIDLPVPNIKGRNNVRIRFYLSPASGLGGNAGKGWFIDDLRVTKSGNQIGENCSDGKDNDGDGKTDCADADCSGTPACAEDCTDGKDNDLDDTIDCKDADCAQAPSCVCLQLDCDDKQPCTTDSCDSKTGKCVHKDNQLGCDDGDLCTTADACGGGKCLGAAKACGDGDPCTADSCDPKLGTCKNSKIAGCGGCKNTADCDDGNACTDDGCDLKTGKCGAKNTKKACDSGDPCSYGDRCDGKGSCKTASGSAGGKTCNDGNACTIDSCDAKTGACSYGHVKDGASCSDGKACTGGDACKTGVCVPSKAECPVFQFKFDCGSSVSGWYLGSNGGSPATRWAVDNTPNNQSPKTGGASGGCSLNYNNGKNYCRRGFGNSCVSPNQSAYIPTFSGVGLTGTPKLTFWTYVDLDGVGKTNTDRPRVMIYSGNTVLHNYYLSKAAKDMKKWRKISLDVPKVKGRAAVRVRFYLSPASGQGGNAGKGWFIDDLKLSGPGNFGAPLKEICGDGKDNDNNGLTDCADLACAGTSSCTEICTDGKDNDLDDKIDCADPDCAAAASCKKTAKTP